MSGERRILDIQVFTDDGVWRKPPGGTHTIEVLARSGGSGLPDARGEDGYVIVVSYE